MNNEDLIVYDGSHLAYRMYYTAVNMQRKIFSGTPVPDEELNYDLVIKTTQFLMMKSVMSFITKLNEVPFDTEFDPASILFLFDAKGSTSYRKQLNPEYKANRSYNPNIHTVIESFKESAVKLNFNVYEHEGLEADDIARIMSQNLDNRILFITEDNDWTSFITEKTILYKPISKMYTTLGTLSERYLPILKSPSTDSKLLSKITNMYKAILGDGSDNVEGIKGIGWTRATKIIGKILNLDDPRDFEPSKSKYESDFKNNIDKYINNLKVLGYAHLEGIKTLDNLYSTEPVEPLRLTENYLEYCNKIESSQLTEKLADYVNLLVRLEKPKLNWK